MAVCLDRETTRPGPFAGATGPGDDATCLTIGLVNNMPDAALQATERQFVALLGAAADGLTVRLTPYALPDIPRTAWGRDYVTRIYSPIADLSDSHLDGLIATAT